MKAVKKAIGMMLFLAALAAVPSIRAAAKDIVIVLDPGHGGPETGASGKWSGKEYKEELLNLKIAKYAKKELEKYSGVKVYLTRTSNNVKAMDRYTRIMFAKNKNAAALVSIHLNATSQKKTTVSGAFAYVPSPGNYPNTLRYAKEARDLADMILEELHSYAGTKNNGWLLDDEMGIILYGMKYKLPSMIVEHCFINNPNDCKKFLKTEARLKKLGVADARAIAKYYNLSLKGSKPKKTGWQKQGDVSAYYFADGTRARNDWEEIDGKFYYFDACGVMQKGVFQAGDDLYLTDDNGVRQTGLVTYNENLYLADENGKLQTGLVKHEGSDYYFDPQTGAARTGLIKIGKYKYFFSRKNYARVNGWVKSSNGYKRYFMAKKNGRMLTNGWLKSKNKWYYFGSNGKFYKSTRKKIKGKWYTFDKNGVCKNKKG